MTPTTAQYGFPSTESDGHAGERRHREHEERNHVHRAAGRITIVTLITPQTSEVATLILPV